MNKIYTIVAFTMCLCMGIAQEDKAEQLDASLKLAIDEIIELATEENLSALDAKYVCEEYGVFEIFRIGVPDVFEQHNSLAFAFSNDKIRSYPLLSSVADLTLKKDLTFRNAKFDCNEMEWDEPGFFVTDTITYPKLTEVLKQPVFETSEFSAELYEKAKYIDEHSYRVVVTAIDLVFYLTKIDQKWYITLYDKVTTDCSA